MGIDTRPAFRVAGCDLLAELGYDPNDVADHNGGLLEFEGETLLLDIVERDADGKVLFRGQSAVTHEERVKVSAERKAAYVAELGPFGSLIR